jgi:PTS system mannose-specific IIB component/fructoselysine and glucoselysine-specific PTS system IIB component
MRRLIQLCPSIRTVNLGGIHHRAGRTLKLRYVYLSPPEEEALRALANGGVAVTAQDVPSARAVALEDVLRGEGER